MKWLPDPGWRMIPVVLAVIASQAAQAQIANDQENFYGDRLRTSVDLKARLRDDGSDVCIPSGTSMIVIGQDTSDLSVKLQVSPDDTDCSGNKPLSSKQAYLVKLADMKLSGVTRTGITYGALMVPFKYQTTGNKDFTGSASIGGYMGYRFETLRRIGVTATPIAFMGASNISVASGSGSNTDNVMGFTYGVGLIGTFKGSFQTGVVIGWDRVGRSVGYQYNGKPWIALEIGYAFLQ